MLKKRRIICLVISLLTVLIIGGSKIVLAEEITAEQEVLASSKISEDLKEEISKLSPKDTISVQATLEGIDENAVMKEFLTEYPELFEEYCKNENLFIFSIAFSRGVCYNRGNGGSLEFRRGVCILWNKSVGFAAAT